ncbi:MAG: fimbrillin family protein, partial [Rikenellaceae bacterium]|nr:fimbrillin family protein [Rikenellaceae bacterium]
MKKLFLSLAAVALMMSACTQDVATPEGNIAIIGDDVAVSATFSPETRTAMAPNADGGLDITWVASDAIGLFGEDANSTIGTNAEYTATTEGKVSGFAYAGDAESIKWGEGTHTFYAYYPYTETGSNYAAIPASIPAVQTQSAAGNLDHLQPYSFLYASCEASKYANGGNIELQFQNAFSVLEVKLCAAEGTIACDAVIFRTTDENEIVSASNILVNLTDGSLDFSNAEATNEIRINLAEAVELNTETPASIYAMITPGHAGKTFQAVAVVGGKEVVLGEMAVPESGIPAGVKAVLSLNVPAPAAEEAIDLSAAGTANCYIVNKANTAYKFNATVKGNGTTALSTDVAAIAPVKAYLLWAQDQPMSDPDQPDEWPTYYGDTNAGNMIDVTSVELKEDGYIYFKTGAEMPNGNAVICATDAEGTIVWSWHMWIVNDYDAASNDYYVTTKGVNTYFMDRNLGAVGNPDKVANPDVNDYAAARGLCYQWGRKDPFTSNVKHNGYASKGMVYDAEGNGTSKYMTYGDDRIFPAVYCDNREEGVGIYDDINKIVAWTAANPTGYMRAGSTTSYKWISTDGTTEEWGKLWGNQGWQSSWDKGGVKTMYDPCPVGYRVPSTGHFIFITAHGDQASTGYGNNFRNWQFNSKEIIFDEAGAVLGAHEKVEPYGLHFYINGAKTKSEGAVDGVQDYGITPDGLQTMYIPCQGHITYSGSPYDNNMYLQTNAPANGQTRWMKTESGNFYYNATSGSYDQQAKAMPVRCIREEATITPEPEPEPEPEVPTGVDLSANGTANTYVVNAA